MMRFTSDYIIHEFSVDLHNKPYKIRVIDTLLFHCIDNLIIQFHFFFIVQE